MEKKIFDLLEKMYGEILDVKEDMKNVRQDLVRLENKVDDGHGKLLDGYKQNYEQIQMLRKQVEQNEIKLKIVK
jgi:hypothetical protein